MGVELYVLQCVRKEVFLRYTMCVFLSASFARARTSTGHVFLGGWGSEYASLALQQLK